MLAPIAGISQTKRGFEILSSFAENKNDSGTTSDLIKSIAAFDSAGNFNYINPLLILLGNKDSLLKRFGATGYYEHLGTFLSFIGDHKNALLYFDKPRYLLESKHPLSKEAITEIKAAKIIPFREFLEDAADKNSVIMIKEAHHVAQHSVTASSVFKYGLKKEYQVTTTDKLKETAFLVQAYYTEEIKRKEISKLIPVDQTYDRDKSYYSLYVGPGNYTVVVRNMENQIIYSKEISIVK
jgi:hypothetical protein